MNELLTTSLVWRLCAMLAGWLRRSPLGRGMRALGRLWRESATYRLFAWLLKRPCAVESSAYCAASERRSARLSAWGQARLLPALRQSLFSGLCQAIGRAFRESLLLGRLCRGGFTAVLLAIVAAYAPLDWLLRDVLQLSLLGSIWDELLLLVGFVWALYQRASAQKPLRSRVSGAGLGVGLYLLIGLVLLVWTWSAPVSVSISGFRASMQYLLLFYLVIDLLRDRADLLFMTKVIVLLGTLIALYGVAQYLLVVGGVCDHVFAGREHAMPARGIAARDVGIAERHDLAAEQRADPAYGPHEARMLRTPPLTSVVWPLKRGDDAP